MSSGADRRSMGTRPIVTEQGLDPRIGPAIGGGNRKIRPFSIALRHQEGDGIFVVGVRSRITGREVFDHFMHGFFSISTEKSHDSPESCSPSLRLLTRCLTLAAQKIRYNNTNRSEPTESPSVSHPKVLNTTTKIRHEVETVQSLQE